MDIEVGVLQWERRVGRHATPGVGIAGEQEIQPDRGVGVRSRLESCAYASQPTAARMSTRSTARRRTGNGAKRHGTRLGWLM